MRFNVRAPQPVTENIVGIPFVEGKADNLDPSVDAHRRALEYFRKAGYVVEPVNDADADELDPQVQPVVGAPKGGPDLQGNPDSDDEVEDEDEPNPPVRAPGRSASRADWAAYIVTEDAGDKRLTDDEAAGLTRDQLADHVYGPKGI